MPGGRDSERGRAEERRDEGATSGHDVIGPSGNDRNTTGRDAAPRPFDQFRKTCRRARRTAASGGGGSGWTVRRSSPGWISQRISTGNAAEETSGRQWRPGSGRPFPGVDAGGRRMDRGQVIDGRRVRRRVMRPRMGCTGLAHGSVHRERGGRHAGHVRQHDGKNQKGDLPGPQPHAASASGVAGRMSSRRSNWAFSATMIVDMLIRTAPIAGESVTRSAGAHPPRRGSRARCTRRPRRGSAPSSCSDAVESLRTPATMRGSLDASTTPGRLDGDVGARADRDANVRLGQRRGVVHAVADHRDALAAGLDLLRPRLLLLRAVPARRPRRSPALARRRPPPASHRRYHHDLVSRHRAVPTPPRERRRAPHPRARGHRAQRHHARDRGPPRRDRSRRPPPRGSRPEPRRQTPAASPGHRPRREHRRPARPPRDRRSPRTPRRAGSFSSRSWASATIAFANGCSLSISTAAASASISSSLPLTGARSRTACSPRVSVPVLSNSTVVTVPHPLESDAVLDEDTILRAHFGRDGDHERDRQAEGMGARDDEDRDGPRDRGVQVAGGEPPERGR